MPEMTQKTIVRMPPSPTGSLHLGTARTGLFNWCFARANGGDIIFRWEDTDKERSKTEFETEIMEGLAWLGMDFESGSTAVTRQTDQTQGHQDALDQLWKEGKIFPCFSTPEEIDAARDAANKAKTNFVFWSPFRDLSQSEYEEKMASKPYVWRIRTPQNHTLSWTDLVKGTVEVNSDTLGDFVIARKDGSVLYMLANVVDDLKDNMTHIIRGDDHISNTPKQLLLLESLGKPAFSYAHIPLVTDQKKRKLSKRNVDPDICVLIKDFQAQGFIPEGVINGLAFLGWNPKSTDEIFSLADLEKNFDLAHVNKAAAQYDFEKMKWFNNQWINRLDIDQIQTYFLEWNAQYGKVDNEKYEQSAAFSPALELARQKAKTLSDIPEELSYLCFDIMTQKESLLNEKMKVDAPLAQSILAEAITMLTNIDDTDFNKEMIREKAIESIAKMELKNGQFLQPVRYALSGRDRSASPFEIAEVIGKELAIARLESLID